MKYTNIDPAMAKKEVQCISLGYVSTVVCWAYCLLLRSLPVDLSVFALNSR